MKKKIIINHIAKTEGHSSFEGSLFGGKIKEARYLSDEGARLIEGLLIGHLYEDVPVITARICGVCPIVHGCASIKALEAAFGIEVSKGVNDARSLMMMGEFLGSHLFHSFFFSLPDLLGYPDDFDMIKKYPKQTKAAMVIRQYGAALIESFGGRAVHPIASQVGGFKVWPSKEKLKNLLSRFPDAHKAIKILLPMFARLKYPVLKREPEYISLSSKLDYAIYEGGIVSTKGLRVSVRDFSNNVKEIQRQREVVKHTSFRGMAYFVGALARINNNFNKLQPESQKAWRRVSKDKITINSFLNIYAQVVEMLDCILVSEKLLKKLLKTKPVSPLPVKIKASVGVGSVEAPRGTLLHYYKINSQGNIIESNIITPTAQFLSNIEEDILHDGKILSKLTDKQRAARIKTLIRAYDPCISCATH